MSSGTTPTTIAKTVPSYLYFQYQDDPDLPALISAYNEIAQNYVDWFNNVELPVYTKLSGKLLDWIGQGIYGFARPSITFAIYANYIGAIATYPVADVATADAIESGTVLVTETPDDIYQKTLTWLFYKGDGFQFSIPWFKRRISRFLYGVNGTDNNPTFTSNISVTFSETTLPIPTCTIVITNAPHPVADYFSAFLQDGILSAPFRFHYNVTLS